MRRYPYLPFYVVLALCAGGLVFAQGSQLQSKNLNGPVAVSGNISATGSMTAGGDVTAEHFISTASSAECSVQVPQSSYVCLDGNGGAAGLTYDGTYIVSGKKLSAGANNIYTTGRYCTDAACTTAYLANDTFGTLNIIGTVGGSGNWNTAGAISTDDYLKPGTGIKNTGTSAACSSNTGAVCINDPGGLAVANGSGTTVATLSAAGYLASTTPHLLTSLELNVAAATATYGGHQLPAKAFTVTALTGYVSSASGGGAGNTTWRVSDGTNNCDCNFPCAGGAGVGSNATGVLRCTPSGTCAFAASSSLTVAVQTAGCTTTQPTIQNIDVEGNWQ